MFAKLHHILVQNYLSQGTKTVINLLMTNGNISSHSAKISILIQEGIIKKIPMSVEIMIR